MAEPINVGPGQGTVIKGPVGGPLTFKARGEQTGGSLTALENVIPPGEGPPVHTHANEDESWYVIEGELRFKLGDELSLATAGSFVFVPRGIPHAFRNVGNEPARLLVMFTPSGMELFFDRFAAPSGEPGPQKFQSIGGEVGMDVIGPPLGDS